MSNKPLGILCHSHLALHHHTMAHLPCGSVDWDRSGIHSSDYISHGTLVGRWDAGTLLYNIKESSFPLPKNAPEFVSVLSSLKSRHAYMRRASLCGEWVLRTEACRFTPRLRRAGELGSACTYAVGTGTLAKSRRI